MYVYSSRVRKALATALTFLAQPSENCQFYQHFTSSFCADILVLKHYKSHTVSRKKLRTTLLYENTACKMLVKLTP